MTIEYWEGSLSKEEEEIIRQTNPELYVHFFPRKPGMSNSAIGDLFGDITIWLNTPEVQAFVNAISLFTAFYGIYKKITNYAKKKTVIKADSEIQMILQNQNIIIQSDNIKILRPESSDRMTEKNYLLLALSVVANKDLPNDREVVISYDGEFHIETIDQYASRKMKV